MSEVIRQALLDRFPGVTFYEKAIGLVAVVPSDNFRDIAEFCRDDERLACDFLHNYAAADFPPDRMEVFVMLYSYRHGHKFTLKTSVDRAEPKLHSLSAVWPAADWYEREMFDLFGIVFAGHPDLRRLFCPDYWVGYPLRKDYQDLRIVPLPEVMSE
ncbi:MAG: NADH-quinone oxidoreductase subunit C [Candidatus Brocadiia bacterium]